MSSDGFAFRAISEFASFELSALDAQSLDGINQLLNATDPAAGAVSAANAAVAANLAPSPEVLAKAAVQTSFSQANSVQRSAEPNAAQQYAALAPEIAQAVESIYADPQQQAQKTDAVTDALALELLLAQNGSLFNGAAGGVAGTGVDANTRAAMSALRERKNRLERGHERVAEITDLTSDLSLSEHDFHDDGSFDEEMAYLDQAQNNLMHAVEERYSSFSDRSGGFIS